MPEYLMLIYMPAENPLSPDEMAEMFPKWDAYTESLRDAGVFLGGNALQGVELATTVRERGGETQITDGPVCRDEGGPRRLLPRRGTGSRHRARTRGTDPEHRLWVARGPADP